MRVFSGLTLVFLIVLATAGSAVAATPLGSTASTGSSGYCSGCTLFQRTSDPGGPSYEVPSDGVITSWNVQLGASDDAIVRLVVVRPLGGDAYRTVGVSYPLIPNNQTRIPVLKGDLLGINYDGRMRPYAPATPGSTIVDAVGDPKPGEPVDTSGGEFSGRLNVSAMLEPDVDRDGQGDETQDRCPSNPTTRQRCADVRVRVTSAPLIAKRRSRVAYAVEIKNVSYPTSAFGVTARIALSGDTGIAPLTVPLGCRLGFYPGAQILWCGPFDLAGSAWRDIDFVAVPSETGTMSVAASASSRDLDPHREDNAASASTTIRYDTRGHCPPPNLIGGSGGRDRLRGSIFSDPIHSGRGNDLVWGRAGDDCIGTGPGNDVVSAGPGNDHVTTGSGRDRITGGSGRDRIVAGAGNDWINASDRAHDIVDCGPGRHDVVIASAGDKLRGCERVRRPS